MLIECITAHREEVRRLFPGGIAGIFRASSDTSHFEANLPGARKILCDLTDTAGLTQAFEGADTVFHAAGIHWSREVAEAAARLKVRRLIAVHTCGIYSKYKAAGEEYRNIEKKVEEICRKHGIDGIVVIGGLTISTFVTLIVVPVLYGVLNRKGDQERIEKIRKKFVFMNINLND